MILTLDAKRRLPLPATLVPARLDHSKTEFDPCRHPGLKVFDLFKERA